MTSVLYYGVLLCIMYYYYRHFYLFKHVKHGTQYIQNDFHQWLSDSFTVHQIRFRPGLCPGSRWGSSQSSPDPLAGFKGPTSNGERREGEGKGRGKGKGREGEKGMGDRPPFSQIPGSALVDYLVIFKPLPNRKSRAARSFGLSFRCCRSVVMSTVVQGSRFVFPAPAATFPATFFCGVYSRHSCVFRVLVTSSSLAPLVLSGGRYMAAAND